MKPYRQFLLDFEGLPEENSDTVAHNTAVDDASNDDDSENELFMNAAFFVIDKSARYRLTSYIPPSLEPDVPATAEQFVLDRYSKERFQGIMPDTGAAQTSTAGLHQFQALQRDYPELQLNKENNAVNIHFGCGDALQTLGSVEIARPIGTVKFYVMHTPTPFLLSLKDMDRLDTHLDNTRNLPIQRSPRYKEIPIVRKWGHPWFMISDFEHASLFLTTPELQRLHRQFGHPTVQRMREILTRASEEANSEVLEMIAKICHHCQMKGAAPRRFRFTFRDDAAFNHEIIVDTLDLDGKSALHTVDTATAFQAGRFLKNMTAKEAWERLRECWIDTHLGPPDILATDAGIQFSADGFRAEARLMGITIVEVPTEAHHSIGKVERYHRPLRTVYRIICSEMDSAISPEAALQMSFKSINDSVGPSGLVPTLVFGAMPRLKMDSPPSAVTMQRAEAISKAMKELKKINAKHLVNRALNTRNAQDTSDMQPLSIPIGSEVLVYRGAKKEWVSPYIMLTTDGINVTVQRGTNRSEFCLPRPRGRPATASVPTTIPDNQSPSPSKTTDVPLKRLFSLKTEVTIDDKQRSKEPEPQSDQPISQRLRPRSRIQQPVRRSDSDDDSTLHREFFTTAMVDTASSKQFFSTHKEHNDRDLAICLHAEGKINTAGAPFKLSDIAKIDSLLVRGVLVPTPSNQIPSSCRIFRLRMVREIKDKTTAHPYEKSRLVVQGHNDHEKRFILTQSPTIQRCS
ncbi:hypothetical protein K3495_g1550 [Podosphaera aphanis]|nr:hypothetical protein K3495_g1550 [Podosphaera aphanis]